MFAPGADFPIVIDGFEPVTIERLGGAATVVVTHALRHAVRVREAERSAGHYTAADIGWTLPAAEIDEPLRPGDAIIDAGGQRWTVLEATHHARCARWRCTARNLAVSHALDSSIDVEKAEFAKGESGAEEPTWHVWRANLRARIQPIAAEIQAQRGRQTIGQRFVVFLETAVPLDNAMRIRGPDEAVYAIVGYRKAAAIDALMEIDAVRAE